MRRELGLPRKATSTCIRLWASLSVFTLFFSGTSADLLLKNLSGKVKFISEEHYNAEEKLIGKEKRVIEGALSHIYYYKFNEEGKLVEENSILGNIKCEYDELGNRTVEYTRVDSIWRKTCVYVSNGKGQFVRDTTFNPFDEAIECVTFYKHDKAGNSTEQLIRFPESGKSRRNLNKYDTKGNIIVNTVIDEDGKVESMCKSYYDSKGFKVKSETYEHKEHLKNITDYTRDSYGNITELAEYTGDNLKTYQRKSSYEYDAKGNWTKEVSYSRGRWVIIKRKIDYY